MDSSVTYKSSGPMPAKDLIHPQPPLPVAQHLLSHLHAAGVPPLTLTDSVGEKDFGSTTASSSVSTLSGSPSLKLSLDSASIEKQPVPSWDGYEEDEIPDKTHGKILRNLRHQIFSIYRRIFGVVFIVNMSILVWILAAREYNAQRLGGIVIANVFSSVVMRQEYVINAFFVVFCSVPTSWPFIIRQFCARVYHIGGLHSGFAVSGIAWLVLFTVQATKEMVHSGRQTSIRTVAITYCILSLFIAIIVLALPAFRQRFHNSFERCHRFMGWAVTVLVWLQFIFLTVDYKLPGDALGKILVKSPYFWLLIIMTCSIILPWIRLRKVPVRTVVLSPHAIRLFFDNGTAGSAYPGTFFRMSSSPLLEWHSFATVRVPDQKGYSFVISRAGDWTSKQIDNPPTHVWIRGIPTFGMLSVAPLFKKIVLVTTGSGIAPCIPWILERRVPIKLLWTSPNIRETFGDELVDSLLAAVPDAVIYDTKKYGRPDIVKLTYRIFKDSDAEAVCVISNEKLTRKVVYGMVSRGVPAFGPIWDS